MKILHLYVTIVSICCLPALFAAPLKVFIMAGEGNMQGNTNISTFDYIGKDPKTADMLEKMTDKNGEPRVSMTVWISCLTDSTIKEGTLAAGYAFRNNLIGPEFSFGHYISDAMSDPVLIIKTSFKAKSLHKDFLSPTAGNGTPGPTYSIMMNHIKDVLSDPKRICPFYDENDGYDIAGFIWLQGWSDLTNSYVYRDRKKPGGYDKYTELLGHFIKDVRKDLNTPKLPFVIGVNGIGGIYDRNNLKFPSDVHQHFRDAQAAVANKPEFAGNVVNVMTEECWDPLQQAVSEKLDKVKKEVTQLGEQQQLTGKQQLKLLDKMLADKLTKEEMDAYKGMSQSDHFYYGSAKIIGLIGKKFAEAMIPMLE